MSIGKLDVHNLHEFGFSLLSCLSKNLDYLQLSLHSSKVSYTTDEMIASPCIKNKIKIGKDDFYPVCLVLTPRKSFSV